MTKPSRKKKRIDPDRELIQAIQAGRHDLFPELVQRYQGVLYNFGMRMCAESRDAEDMVQDTFLNVFKYIDGFRYETQFRNWLYRIATSACVKKRRRSKYAPERELSLDEFLPSDEAKMASRTPDWATKPLDRVLNEELGHILRKAVLDLPENHRVVLVLRDIEGFSTEESAQILNLSAANIKVRLHRARLFLRDKLKTYFEEV